ncbi:nitrilase-like protein 2 [Camellia sinensis]|uniref:nitrilase-like protein 2 n=1 Tax=Camellia sinensis TaxID=4442 RepID=UPI0010368AC9|nr:nitrilase-like protein 2 [Camellia sinensis]
MAVQTDIEANHNTLSHVGDMTAVKTCRNIRCKVETNEVAAKRPTALSHACVSYKESSFTEAGKKIVAVDSPVGRLGLTVCYDLRFPEIYQQLRFNHEAQVLLIPAAFTKVTGQAHWEILLRARAIETQCYVIAAAQAGNQGNVVESQVVFEL